MSRRRRVLAILLVAFPLLGLPVTGCTADPPRQEPTWWQPSAKRPLALHWVLGGRLDVHDPRSMGLRDHRGRRLPAPDVYDIDGELNPKSTVDLLHRRGKKVICYFDAGAYESYRRDAWKFKRLKPRIWGHPRHPSGVGSGRCQTPTSAGTTPTGSTSAASTSWSRS